MINHFNATIAVDFDVNVAIFLQKLSEWTFLNLANERNLHDGLCWSYNTLEAYGIIFPFWTKRQLETVIKNVVEGGLVVKGNYNNHKYDRTTWYALTHKALLYYPEITTERNLQLMANTISPKCEMYNNKASKEENIKNHFTKLCQTFHVNVTPIPTIYTTKKEIIPKGIIDTSPESVDLPLKTKDLDLKDLKADNPYEIPDQMLVDWISIRKQKKARITRTAWGKMNNTMTQIKAELNISPVSAFETMVANCWQSLDVKYFRKDEGTNKTGLNGSGRPKHEQDSWI